MAIPNQRYSAVLFVGLSISGIVAVDEPAQAASGTRTAEDEDQWDSAWLRWLKLFSIILVPAVALGVALALGDYVRQYTATTQFNRAVARGFVQLDTREWFRIRFLLGACVGAAFGLLRYLIRRAGQTPGS